MTFFSRKVGDRSTAVLTTENQPFSDVKEYTSSVYDASTVTGVSNRDSFGLEVIHQPKGSRSVHLIFIHGLRGGSRRTWTSHGETKTFWPLEFLPLEPQFADARILTFGYSSDHRDTGGRLDILLLDVAERLLHDLKYSSAIPPLMKIIRFKEQRSRPLVKMVTNKTFFDDDKFINNNMLDI